MNEVSGTRDTRTPVDSVVTMESERHGKDSIAGLLRQFVDETSVLMRKELALAATEIKDAVSDIKTGVGSVAAGGAVLYAGLLFLLAAGASALTLVVPEWAARLIVGVVVAIIGFVMLQAGKKKLSPQHFKPERAAAALRKDQEAVKRHTP